MAVPSWTIDTLFLTPLPGLLWVVVRQQQGGTYPHRDNTHCPYKGHWLLNTSPLLWVKNAFDRQKGNRPARKVNNCAWKESEIKRWEWEANGLSKAQAEHLAHDSDFIFNDQRDNDDSMPLSMLMSSSMSAVMQFYSASLAWELKEIKPLEKYFMFLLSLSLVKVRWVGPVRSGSFGPFMLENENFT